MNNLNHFTKSSQNKLVLSILLTSIIFLAELIGGIWTRSLALLSDSAHVFMDMFALGLSYFAFRVASRPADDRHTYGFHRFQILAALINGTTLLLIAIEILREAIQRFKNPEPILTSPMLVVAVIGLIVNLIVAFILHDHDHKDINTRSAFLHVIGDALASVGVIVAGVIIALTGLTWVDALVSILISILLLVSAARLLLKAFHILAEGMPDGMTASQIAETMQSVSGVVEVHDLHVWTLSPSFLALSAHVLVEDQSLSQSSLIMEKLKAVLAENYNIQHTTIQFECLNCGQGMAFDCDSAATNHVEK